MAAGSSTRIATFLAVAVLAALFSGTARATTPGPNGRIVFASTTNDDLYFDLFSVNPDGSDLRRLTWTPQSESTPAWSPDGTRIAYTRFGAAIGNQIWVMNADGSGQTQLSSGASQLGDTDPTWSPDGKRIAFSRGTGLSVMNADGSSVRSVISGLATDPDWSPNGMQIAYAGQNGIGIVGADGSNPHTISAPGAPASQPSWSPDGGHILFVRNNPQGYPGELYVINTDGSGERQLTSDGFENESPSWSPDGTQIVFGRTNAGFFGWNLWVIGADGSGLRQLTTNAANTGAPAWGTLQLVPETSPPLGPAVLISGPNDGATFFQGVPASSIVFYQCVSYVSVIVSCQGDQALGAPPDTSFAGTHTLTVRAVDAAGRTATASITYEVADFIPPLVTLGTPANGATYPVGSQVVVDYSCSDPNGTGILDCLGDKPNGSLLDTTLVGTFTFRVIGIDNARNSRTVTVTYTITGQQQTITFAPIPDHTYGDPPVVLSAIGGASGNPVTFTATGSCRVDGTTLILSAGTCTVTAHQASGSGYGQAEASQTFSTAKGTQSIGFDPLPDRAFGDLPFTVSATPGLSGNTVTFTSSGQCRNVFTTVSLTGAGTCTITAHEAGSSDVEPAPDVSRTFAIARAPQSIGFASLPGRLYGDGPFTVSATEGESGNPVSFSGGGACTIADSTVTLTDIGSCTITAHEDGDANYLSTDVTQMFAINPPPGCNQPGRVHASEHFTYASSDVFIQSGGTCAPSLQQAAVQITLGGKQLVIDAGQSAVTSETFMRPGDAVIMGIWNGTTFRVDLHDGGKGGNLDTLRVRYGDLDTGTLTAIHGDVSVNPG